ncbi:TPA: hypothetical protein U7D18_001775 [Streptococcus agalactiae]|nr:hypothetical protein [Streptococcus agalactiae]HEN6965510.1 hypothetical protein [Streptococcus agalactiae]
MKKYLSIVALLTILFSSIYYLYYFDGSLYLPKGLLKENTRTNFVVKGDTVLHKPTNKPFVVKGVDVESSLAGYHHNDFPITQKTYREWFHLISNMGANTVRVKVPMNVAFYDALYHHNKESKRPLYLLQGIRIDSYRNNASITAFNDNYRGYLKREAKGVVDILHGRKQVWNTDFGSRHYHYDLSPWVLGYVVGDDWNSGTVAYTNHQEKKTQYKGRYFKTSVAANPFEVMLAQVMDELTHYETAKYGWQHLISFSNSPTTDPFHYRKPFEAQAPKYVQLNVENIQANSNVKAGMFAAYKAIDFHPRYKDYLLFDKENISKEDRQKIKELSLSQGYVKLLNAYHKIPVLVTGYGYSTARGIAQKEIDKRPLPINEKEQGQRLLEDYESFISSGSFGATINAWQDDWNARAWNTSFATNKHSQFLWGDAQVFNQGYGLLGFKNAKHHYQVDGKRGKGEWKHPLMTSATGDDLYASSDESYLYLAIKTKPEKLKEKRLLPIDITPKSGSRKMNGSKVTFSKSSDFVLSIDPNGKSELFVQERYNALKANYLRQLNGKDFYAFPPKKNSSNFEQINMVLRNTKIVEDMEKVKATERFLPTHPIGLLKTGTTDRHQKTFDSQTDISFGKDFIEVRIPWQLLNFSDPSSQKIHDDYFKHYGVKELEIESIALELGANSKENTLIKMADYRLKNWERPDTKTFLKDSYYSIKKEWSKERERTYGT